MTIIALAGIIILMLLTACSSEEGMIDDECCHWCVGPDGGEREIKDPDNPMVGVKIVVPQGA